MNTAKILLIVVLLVSVVSAFADIPYMGAITGIVGLVYGLMAVEEDRRVYFLVVAVALGVGAGSLGGIPAVGEYLTSILTTLGSFAAAGSMGVIAKGISERLM